jgi:hypothetical protein
VCSPHPGALRMRSAGVRVKVTGWVMKLRSPPCQAGMLRATPRCCTWVVHPARFAYGNAEPIPVSFARSAEVELSVGGREQAHGAAGGMVVAGLYRDVAVIEVAGALEIHHGDLGMQQGGMDPLSLA